MSNLQRVFLKYNHTQVISYSEKLIKIEKKKQSYEKIWNKWNID